MYRRLVILAVVVAVGLSVSTVLAQCGCGAVSYAPTYTSYYTPSVAYYAPATQVAYYAPADRT